MYVRAALTLAVVCLAFVTVILLAIATVEKPLDAFHALPEPALHLDDVVESL